MYRFDHIYKINNYSYGLRDLLLNSLCFPSLLILVASCPYYCIVHINTQCIDTMTIVYYLKIFVLPI